MKKKPPPIDAPPGPFNSAFARLKDRLPDAPASPPAAPSAPEAPSSTAPPSAARSAPPPPTRSVPSTETPAPSTEKPGPARAVVRLERKGRGGKEATVIEKLALPPRELAAWADAAKRSLGCGGGVEGDAIVLQGDQRERAAGWLEGRRVRKIVLG